MTYRKAREAYYAAVQEHQGELQCQLPGVNSDDWFAAPGSKRELLARKRCLDCPIFWECQGYAVEAGIPDGTWGGMDERTRDRI